jgi:uncharacterized membrane protein
MDYLLIIILGIVVVSLWNSSRAANERMREEMERLERELDFLRSQIAALVKAKEASATATPVVPTPAPAPQAQPAPESSVPASAATHAAAAPVAAFKAPVAETAPTMPAQEPKPWFDVPPVQRPAVQTQPIAPDKQTVPPPQTAASISQTAAPFNQAPVPPSPTAASEAEPAQSGGGLFSFEQTLGANWLNKLGIAILIIGLAFFLAVKLQTWGPAGKVLCGFAVSLALLGGGVWLERKPTYRIFGRGGIGGGWALAYFTTFAMYHLQAARIVDSLPVDLVLMLLVAAGMVAHSLRYRSQTVTALAFMLGFATLLTSHVEEPNQTVIFSLTASLILAGALVIVTTLRHWAELELCGLIAVYLSHLVWLAKVLPENHAEFAEFWPSTALILIYWLIFRLAYVLRSPLDKKEENTSSVSAVLNSGGVLGLLKFQSAHPEWTFWALLALGGLEMGLAYWAKPKRRQAFVVLSTIATVLLVASVPFRFHGVSWPVLWLVEAQVLAICGLRLGEPVFRRLGLLTGLLTGAVLAVNDVLPLAFFRVENADLSRHWSLTAALALAALLYWTHAEVYTHLWPKIAERALEAFALKITSWLALAAAATCLWVVLPDRWLAVGWLALFLLLVFLGHRFGAIMPPLEGDLLAFLAAGVLIFHHVLPLVFFRFENADAARHLTLTGSLGFAALAFWVRGEVFPRVLPKLPASTNWDPGAWEAVILPLSSFLGTAAAATALWVVLPSAWVAVGWLALVIVLGLAADGNKGVTLAAQADLLTIASVLWLNGWDLWRPDWDHRTPLLIAVGLLYCGMRRKMLSAGSSNYIPAAYSWAAAVFLPFLAFDIFKEPWIVPVLTVLALALFEIGRLVRKGFLRWQGYAVIAIAFTAYISGDLPYSVLSVPATSTAGGFSFTHSLLLEVVILLGGGYWLLERTRNRDCCSRLEHAVGLAADAAGTFCLVLWLGGRFPLYVAGGQNWIAALWAAMGTVLLGLAWLMRRRTFLVQAIALAVAAVLRGLLFDLGWTLPASFWYGSLFHLAVAAVILLAALPFAFLLRGPEFWKGAAFQLPEPIAAALRHPEQWFFFAPYGLMVAALAVKLSSGHITIAWSLLGLGAFLFALAVGERSFRLAGLALLLISVAKILLMDVWALSPSDRYTTLIILGAALVTVSFLYTRFSATIRKFL